MYMVKRENSYFVLYKIDNFGDKNQKVIEITRDTNVYYISNKCDQLNGAGWHTTLDRLMFDLRKEQAK